MTARPEAQTGTTVLECVINISEGGDRAIVAAVAGAGAGALLDVHSDAHHNRSVITLGGSPATVEAAARAVTRSAVERIDVSSHRGVHPRIGAVDVVPFVALTRPTERPRGAGAGRLAPGDIADSVLARDRFARWAARELDVPCFLYGPPPYGSHRQGPHRQGPHRQGPQRTLPELRRQAWKDIKPDFGPHRAHPRAGATAAGARGVLVAYNLWLAEPDLAAAKLAASELRSPAVRTLALGWSRRSDAETDADDGAGADLEAVQVSCNLIDPWTVGPAAVFDFVASRVAVERAELVGLLPGGVLDDVAASRWKELDLTEDATIESRLEKGFAVPPETPRP